MPCCTARVETARAGRRLRSVASVALLRMRWRVKRGAPTLTDGAIEPARRFSYGKDSFMTHTQAKTCIWLVWVVVLTLHEIFKIPDPTAPLTKLIGKLCLCEQQC